MYSTILMEEEIYIMFEIGMLTIIGKPEEKGHRCYAPVDSFDDLDEAKSECDRLRHNHGRQYVVFNGTEALYGSTRIPNVNLDPNWEDVYDKMFASKF